MTKEQAMQALEEVGRKDSKAYEELAALSTDAKAETEKRKQEELDVYNKRDIDSLEAVMPNNPNHKKDGLGISVGDKFNQGQKIIVVNNKPDENYDGRKDAYEVITKVIKPALFDSNDKMIQTAQVEVTIFNTKEEADAAIKANYEKIKSLQGKKQNKINSKIEINNNRYRNKEQKNAGAPVLDGYSNAWFAYYTPEGPENRVSFKTQQEALNWIDSKYDAELAALEAKPLEAEKKPIASNKTEFTISSQTKLNLKDFSEDTFIDIQTAVIQNDKKTLTNHKSKFSEIIETMKEIMFDNGELKELDEYEEIMERYLDALLNVDLNDNKPPVNSEEVDPTCSTIDKKPKL